MGSASGYLKQVREVAARVNATQSADSLAEVIRAMGSSVELDYPRPEPDDDWNAVFQSHKKDWPRELTPRWYPLFIHEQQHAFWNSGARIIVMPAGRRSGKSERSQRLFVKRVLESERPDGRFLIAAPTHDQARDLFWPDILEFIPPSCIAGTSETIRQVSLTNGATIRVVGVDKPQRVEGGKGLDGILLDEFAECKPDVWTRHIGPALNTMGREGWAIITGVPRAKRHYRELYEYANSEESGDEWGAFFWVSEDILSPKRIAAAKDETDAFTYAAEYLASFETSTERIYHAFDREMHLEKLAYDPNRPLLIGLDFNISPGSAVIAQEQAYKGSKENVDRSAPITAFLDEVHIPTNSHTARVCEHILSRYGGHQGAVVCYGDATGGNRTRTPGHTSDWDIVRQVLGGVFGNRLRVRVPSSNPTIYSRIRDTNHRLRSAANVVRMLIDPGRCPHLVIDFEDMVPDKHGEPDKKSDPKLSHWAEAAGYMISYQWPVRSRQVTSTPLY